MKKGKIAVVFPGQGAQRPGMGKDYYDNLRVCRETYEEASHAAGWDVADLCFGDDERLNLTEYTQPCVLTTEIAMLRGLKTHFDFSPHFFGGHSLGEFTALVAAGVLSLTDAVQIVQERGRLMQEAVPVGFGAMAAVISDDIDVKMMQKALEGLDVDIANINSMNQVVISGESVAIGEAESRLRDFLGAEKPLRCVLLNVSAPFHSRFMDAITERFEQVLRGVGQGMNADKSVVVTSNFTGHFHTGDYENLICNLVSQLNHPVQWVENMRQLAARADAIYEVGPGRPLRDFFRSIDVTCSSITHLATAERVFAKTG